MIKIPYPFALETDRLILRSPAGQHARQLNECIRSSMETLRVWMHWAQTTPSFEDSLANCRKAETKFREQVDFRIHIFAKEGEKMIGCTGLHSIDWKVPKFEIGYWLRQSETGKGYMTEAVRTLTAYTFTELNARRVEIRSSALNEKSCRVAERAGFELEGTLRHFTRHVDGSLRDTRIYAKIADL